LFLSFIVDFYTYVFSLCLFIVRVLNKQLAFAIECFSYFQCARFGFNKPVFNLQLMTEWRIVAAIIILAMRQGIHRFEVCHISKDI